MAFQIVERFVASQERQAEAMKLSVIGPPSCPASMPRLYSPYGDGVPLKCSL